MIVNSVLPYSTITRNNANKSNLNINFNGKIKTNIFKNEVTDVFEKLAKIPSPPLKESAVSDWILAFCKQNKIKAELDNYKNVKLTIPATDETKSPLMFSAHMDVVGDNSPVNLIKANGFIKTDGKRTLGADDKSGVAAALMLAKEFANTDIKHGGLEMLFTRDEELGMTGIINADLSNILSKYVVVLDEATLGKFDNAGAGYTTVKLSVSTQYGGHSGMDIKDKKRLNAAKIISDLISEFPQGVWCEDKSGNITSLNVGTIIAGDIQNSAAKILEDKLVTNNYLDYFMKNSVTNVINTKAMATLSIRSTDKLRENELRQKLCKITEKYNKKYKGLASVDINYEELMPIFEKTNDKKIENLYLEACKKLNMKPNIGTFPAGAETHIYTSKKNKNKEFFIPVLLGIANIFNMHSPREKMNIASLKKGYELIREIFLKFNNI